MTRVPACAIAKTGIVSTTLIAVPCRPRMNEKIRRIGVLTGGDARSAATLAQQRAQHLAQQIEVLRAVSEALFANGPVRSAK